jgi:hypothetical protein
MLIVEKSEPRDGVRGAIVFDILFKLSLIGGRFRWLLLDQQLRAAATSDGVQLLGG